MDQFHHRHHVRLRCRVHGTIGSYLHAVGDGHGVSLHHSGASMNEAWAVHRHPGQNGQYLLLHSAAYGRYLAATDVPAPPGHRGLRVEQRNYNHPELEAMVWQAILSESGEEVYLRNIGGACLRANGRFGNSDATVDYVDDLDNISRAMLWVVEPIPAREIMPRLPRPTALPGHQLVRVIKYVLRNDHGALVAGGSFVFRGRSVFRLRTQLAIHIMCRPIYLVRVQGEVRVPLLRVPLVRVPLAAIAYLNVADPVMCLPTRDGRLFPLVVDLSRNHQTLHIVAVIVGTPAHAALRYADADAWISW